MSSPVASAPKRSGGEWLDSWDPENAETWDSCLAWKTLWITTFNLTLGLRDLVPGVGPGPAAELHRLLTWSRDSCTGWWPARSGRWSVAHRLDVPAAHPGYRKLVWMSTALLLIPLIGWGMVVNNPSTSYTVRC